MTLTCVSSFHGRLPQWRGSDDFKVTVYPLGYSPFPANESSPPPGPHSLQDGGVQYNDDCFLQRLLGTAEQKLPMPPPPHHIVMYLQRNFVTDKDNPCVMVIGSTLRSIWGCATGLTPEQTQMHLLGS